MYLCFEEDDKRMMFPERALVSVDDNGFTIHAAGQGRGGKDILFLNIASFQGAIADFGKALGWIKKNPKPKQVDLEFTNSAGEVMGPGTAKPAQPKPAAPKLPETPSF